MKVAVVGYGLEGKASYQYWLSRGEEVVIVDEKDEISNTPEGAVTILGAAALNQLEDFDLIIRTPPLRPDRIKTNGQIWSATNEFFTQCPAPIIGVTGTKGKGTTSSIVAEILASAGETVHLVGNIGAPALEALPHIVKDDVVVYELSSFQLWDLEKSPETAVVLMIGPDHLDVHNSMEEYVGAKVNIGAHQTSQDLLIYHPSNKFSAQVAHASPAQKRRYMSPEGAQIINQNIVIEENNICNVSEVGLIGPHNLENICAAITAAWNYTQDIVAIKSAVLNFTGLPHRLEFVRELDGVGYFDDSFSSAPGSLIAAVKSFTEPEILICGGYDRGLDYSDLAEALSTQQNIKRVLLIGQTKDKIATAFDKVEFENYEKLDITDFSKIIQIAHMRAKPGDVVVLSPGCASFDMFKNFKDRGEQFQQIVGEL